jgi:hypothetical protein
MKFAILALIPVAVLLVACAKVLDVPTPYVGDKLVVFGVLSPDSIPTVIVTRTFPTVGTVDLRVAEISQATVYLLKAGRVIGQLPYQGSGRYQANTSLQVQSGEVYSYSVVASGFPSVQSDAERIPLPPLSLSVSLGESTKSPLNGSVRARKIHCLFSDDARTADFYSLEFEQYNQANQLAFNTFGLDRTDDVEDGCGFKSRNRLAEYNLQDLCFSNGIGQLTIGAELEGFVRTGANRGQKIKAERMVITLRRTNRGYQEYNRTFYIESDDPFQAFDPPKVRYSNVKGGYGFVGAYSQRRVSVQLQ